MAANTLPLDYAAPSRPGSCTGQPRARVLLSGVLIDRVDFASASARLDEFLHSGSAHHVVTVNLDHLSIAQRNASFHEVINRADLAVADGMPLVWASHLRAETLPQRITGFELVHESCRLAVRADRGVFLLGSAPPVAAAAADHLRARYPSLRVDVYSPPFGPLTAEEQACIVRTVCDAQPGFLFVALGAPRQELWIRQHLDELRVPVALGVGCVMDVLAGAVRRAPVWMQHAGFEWTFRLLQEPERLWRRYFVDDLPMLGKLLVQSMREHAQLARCTNSVADGR